MEIVATVLFKVLEQKSVNK